MLDSIVPRTVRALLLLALLSGCAGVSRPRPIAPEGCWANQEQFEARTRA